MNSLHKLTLNINKIYNKNNINKDLLQLKTLINKYNGDDWTKYIKYSKNYDKKLIYNNNLYELFVISWMPQSQSYIHDHSNNGCLFKILNGNLTEYLYNKDIELIKKKEYSKNKIGYINNNNNYHKMFNETFNMSYSLHLYSPPLYKMNIYKKD